MVKICVFRVKYFFCFILFMFCSHFSEGFDSHVSLFCFFSISGIAPLYFKDKIGSNGVSFLQEIHSDSKVEQKWKKDFKGPIFFLTESQILVTS